MQTLLRSKWVLVLLALLIAGGVWYALSPAQEGGDLTSTPSAGSGASVDQGIVSTLLTLRAVKLEGTIFSDPAFNRLKDFSTEIVPEPVGRANPFAPLSSQSAASLNTQRSTTTPTR